MLFSLTNHVTKKEIAFGEATNFSDFITGLIDNETDLSFANFSGHDLTHVDFSRLKLHGCKFSIQTVYDCNFNSADMENCIFTAAAIADSSFLFTNLKGSIIENTKLISNDFSSADFRGSKIKHSPFAKSKFNDAYFTSVQISESEKKAIIDERTIVAEGDIVGYYRLENGEIARLKIPSTAKRVGGVISRLCRSDIVEVLAGHGRCQYLSFDNQYRQGFTVYHHSFEEDPFVYGEGIPFFLTYHEALNFNK